MSAGKVHTRASIALTAGFLVGAIATHLPADFQYAAGSLVGVMISPDCDVDGKFIAYHYIRKSLGFWAEKIWDWLWYFYRRSLKHGSELSHFPIIGTLGRITYLFFFCVIIPYVVLRLFFPFSWTDELSWWIGKICQHWRVVMGLMSADFIHWGLDVLTTEHVGNTWKHGFWGFVSRTFGLQPPNFKKSSRRNAPDTQKWYPDMGEPK
jgi:uncharacterized metal-binding protein